MDVDPSELNDCCARLAKRFKFRRMQGIHTTLRVENEGHFIAKRVMKLLRLEKGECGRLICSGALHSSIVWMLILSPRKLSST